MAQFWEQQLHTIREQVVMMSGLTERNLRTVTDSNKRQIIAVEGLEGLLSLVQAVAQLHGGSFTLADAQPGLRAVLRLASNPPTP